MSTIQASLKKTLLRPFRRTKSPPIAKRPSPLARLIEQLEDRTTPSVSFLPPSSFGTGAQGPISCTSGDFNNDGKLDVAVANYQGSSVGVLLGNGSGSFAPAAAFSSGGGGYARSIATGDFNGDGNLDITVANWYGNVGVLLGDGKGGFTTTSYSTGGSNPHAVSVGDFNGDGKLDLAVANHNSNSIAILLGSGTGSFSAPSSFASGGVQPDSMTAGDFNGDGKLDIAVTNLSSNNLGVLLGNGDGTFAPVSTLSTGGTFPRAIVNADFNGDGKLDLAVSNGGTNTVGVLIGNGSGSFAAAATVASGGSSPFGLTAGDFDGDGKLDLACTNANSDTVGILTGDGSGGFAAAVTFGSGGTGPQSIAKGDFNGDGRLDLVATNNPTNNIGLLLNASASPSTVTFHSATNVPTGAQIEGLTSGDFNNDGKVDLVSACNSPDSVGLFLGDGNGGFAGPVASNSGGSSPGTVVAADFNSDGNLDIAVSNYGTNTVGVLLGNGKGGFAPTASYSSGGGALVSVTAGDFNGDGKLDLVTSHQYDVIGVLIGNGTGGFAPVVTYASGHYYPYRITTGDFNNDGKLDLVTPFWYGTEVGIMFGNGNGGLSLASIFSTGALPLPGDPYGSTYAARPDSAAVWDFNGDGNSDLAVSNNGSNTVSVLLGTGTGNFSPATNYLSGLSTSSVKVADFNGDGKADLVAANYTSNTVSVLLGTGTGTFGPATTFAVGTNPQSVTIGDFNGDGRPDIATGNRFSNNISILLNDTVPPNSAPTVTVDAATVGANEGGTVSNTGTFGDVDAGNTVTVSASFGTVTQSAGTWSWSAPVDDGPAGPITVTVTATDNQNATTSTTFTYTVANVAPTATLSTNSGIAYGTAATASLTGAFDPSTTDTAALFRYAFSIGTDTTGSATYATGGTSNSFDFGVLPAGTYTVYARIIDKDDGFTAYSSSLVVDKASSTTTVTAAGGAYTGSAFGVTSVLATGAGGLNDSNPAHFTFTYVGTGTTTYGPTATPPKLAGTYTVTATYPGDANHLGSSSTPAAFTVGPRLLALSRTNGSNVNFIDWVNASGVTLWSIPVPVVTSTSVAVNFGAPTVAVVNDRDGDGYADLFIGSQSARKNLIGLVSGKSGNLLWSSNAFVSTFAGGVNVAAGDITGDGNAELIVAPASSGGPNVRAFQQAATAPGTYSFSLIRDFYAYAGTYTGGVAVAVADVNKDGLGDIITGTVMYSDNVRVFSAGNGTGMIADFFAFNRTGVIPGYTGGVSVAGGDLNGDGYADIVTSTLTQNSRVRVYSGGINAGLGNTPGTLLMDFTTSTAKIGTLVMAADFGDGKVLIDTLTDTGASVMLNAYGYNGTTTPTTMLTKAYSRPLSSAPPVRLG